MNEPRTGWHNWRSIVRLREAIGDGWQTDDNQSGRAAKMFELN